MEKKKIVLYGGPCGGKSTTLNDIVNYYKNNNKKTNQINEIASLLLNLGYLCEYPMDRIDFQNLLFIIQFIKEYNMELSNDYIICDRGLLDGMAYIKTEEFDSILNKNKIKKSDIMDTYDKALYFRSIAYEYPKKFKDERKYDKIEDAIARDIRSKEIWKFISLPNDYENTMTFTEKKKMLINLLVNAKYSNKRTILADYYTQNKLKQLSINMEELLEKNNVPDDVIQKTRRLVK